MKYLFVILSFFIFHSSQAQEEGKQLFFMLMYSAPGSIPVDSDAAGYISRVEGAGGTLSQAQKDSIHVFCYSLKANSLWTKVYDAGPIAGGTSASNAETLKGVIDITWVNSPTQTNGVVSFNGTNQYGNTGIAPSAATTLNSGHLAYYSTQNVSDAAGVDMGSWESSNTNVFQLAINYNGSSLQSIYRINANTASNFNQSDNRGLFIANRNASNIQELYRNGVSQTQGAVNTTGISTKPVYIGAFNSAGTATDFSPRACAYWSVGAGMTATEIATYSTLVNNLKKAFGVNTY